MDKIDYFVSDIINDEKLNDKVTLSIIEEESLRDELTKLNNLFEVSDKFETDYAKSFYLPEVTKLISCFSGKERSYQFSRFSEKFSELII